MRDAFDVLIVGGGSFGTALATALARNDQRVLMWVRNAERADEVNRAHTNTRYLPGYELPENITATLDLEQSVRSASTLITAVPSRSFREVVREMGNHVEGDQVVVHTTKGFELDTFRTMSAVLREETCALKTGVLSGPSLAREIMAGDPAGLTVASRYNEVIGGVQQLFQGSQIRVYGGHDVVGTEVGGAVKNIIALAAGMSDGMGFGDNTKALLLTRGLGEMARVGVAMGADVFTFSGLSGMGDLMATCASSLSRNHQVGERLAQGETLEEILASVAQVAEGVPTAAAVHAYAAVNRVDLPIVRAVHAVLYEGYGVREEVAELMQIPVGDELAALRYR